MERWRLMARAPFVDAHFHLWDRDRIDYPWLDDPGVAAIASTYTLADYRNELAAWNLVGAVHVEAGAAPDAGAAETDWLNTVADENGLPDGVVARVALDDPGVEAKLEQQAAAARVKGIRHLVNWHPSDPGRRAYDRDLTADPAWRRGYAALARHGLSFDFHGFPPQLPNLAEVAIRHPEVALIVNHLGLPILADGLEEWRTGIAALAAMPHVAIKLSGAGFIASPFDPARFRHLVLEVIDRFGADRVMVATNLATDRLFADLDTTLSAYEALLADFSESERRDMWGRNANRIYRLGLAL